MKPDARNNISEPAFTELREALQRLNTGKPPGGDSVPPMVLKGLGNYDTPRLLALVNSVFRRGGFPKRWKTTRLSLLNKPGKDPARPDAYRPICIVDAGSKLLEYLIDPEPSSRAGGPRGLRPKSVWVSERTLNGIGYRLC